MSAGGGEKAGWAALAATVGAALLYNIGWIYVTSWFGQFGISAVGIDIPRDDVIIWGVQALATRSSWIVFIAIFITVIIAAWRHWILYYLPPSISSCPTYITWSIGGSLAAVGILFGTNWIAVDTAKQHAVNERLVGFRDRPAIEIHLTTPLAPSTSINMNDGCHRLLIRTKDSVVLIRPRQGEPDAVLQMNIIPMSQIAHLKATPVAGPCP
jgi:hypothetical protein